MIKIMQRVCVCVIAAGIGMGALAETQAVSTSQADLRKAQAERRPRTILTDTQPEKAPKKFKNPRLNALLVPIGDTEFYTRITPTQRLSYHDNDNYLDDSQRERFISPCDTVKDEETFAILRCPSEIEEGVIKYEFYRFQDAPIEKEEDKGRCLIICDSTIDKKDFLFEHMEPNGRLFFYSTAPGCKAPLTDRQAKETPLPPTREIQVQKTAPKKFKNPRLNALLAPYSRPTFYTRITPTEYISYTDKNPYLDEQTRARHISLCDTVQDEETFAVLRCPSVDKNGKKSYYFYRFRNYVTDNDYHNEHCPIEQNSAMSTDKDFQFKEEAGSSALLYSTAPGCKTSITDSSVEQP